MSAATLISLRLEPIQGEVTDRNFRDEIEILNWNWFINRAAPDEGGATTGRATFGEFRFRKFADRATPELMRHVATGNQLPSARLSFRTPVGETSAAYFIVTLEDVVIKSVEPIQISASARPLETLSLTFRRLTGTYFYSSSSGAALDYTFWWDLDLNEGQGTQGTTQDQDRDGIPDRYELAFGLNPLQNDADLDQDRDGLTNYEEFLAGTEANNPNSVLKARVVYVVGQPQATLSWTSAAGESYRVLRAQTVQGVYSSIGTYPSAGDGTTSIPIPASASMNFYLIELVTGN